MTGEHKGISTAKKNFDNNLRIFILIFFSSSKLSMHFRKLKKTFLRCINQNSCRPKSQSSRMVYVLLLPSLTPEGQIGGRRGGSGADLGPSGQIWGRRGRSSSTFINYYVFL